MRTFEYTIIEGFKSTKKHFRELSKKGWYGEDVDLWHCDIIFHPSGYVLFQANATYKDVWVRMRLPKKEIKKAVFKAGSDFTKSVEYDTPEEYWRNSHLDMGIVLGELLRYDSRAIPVYSENF